MLGSAALLYIPKMRHSGSASNLRASESDFRLTSAPQATNCRRLERGMPETAGIDVERSRPLTGESGTEGIVKWHGVATRFVMGDPIMSIRKRNLQHQILGAGKTTAKDYTGC